MENVLPKRQETNAGEDAEIRARITGNIVERAFDEGQVVQEGDLLYRIDPRPYQAALNVARAELSQAEAAVSVAERNLRRGEELAPDGYISDAEMDQLRGEFDRATAQQEAASAAVEKAEIDLGFTDIRAPFTGTAGRSQLSIGDLVDPVAFAFEEMDLCFQVLDFIICPQYINVHHILPLLPLFD